MKEGKERGGGRMNTKNSRGFLRMWRWPEEEEEMVVGGDGRCEEKVVGVELEERRRGEEKVAGVELEERRRCEEKVLGGVRGRW